ncbi:hypothetical protein BC827DRAFT_1272293 [Russula dissimulans]|nr:hypothetical protein BC827DRAFT_1272293 [Russula dissimulans]
MPLSSMITLPPSSARGLYSCWKTYPRIASPGLSPPVSPAGSPPLMFTPSARLSDGFYSSWQYPAELASPTGSGRFSPPMNPPSSPLHTINEVFNQRASRPVSLASSGRQNSDSDSRPSSMSITTSLTYSYAVKSINSYKSRLTVLYPRPVRPQRLSVGVESIPESTGTDLESPTPLSSRPVSLSISLQGELIPISDKQATTENLSVLFDASFVNLSPVEHRLSASWKSLLKIKAYEETRITPNLRTTKVYADTLLCVHNEIVEQHFVGAPELSQPCVGLNKAFEDAYVLLSNSGTIPQAPEHRDIPALDADLFKSFVVTIMQLIKLIRALEVLMDSLAILAVVKASKVASKADLDDDVIFNVPGWRQRRGSRPTLPSAAAVPEEAGDNTLRRLLVTRNEELERELGGLRLLLGRANPRAKAKLGNIVKLTLPLQHEELMKSPVGDLVAHWQAAVVSSGTWNE